MKQIPKNASNEDFLYIRAFNMIKTTDICRKLGLKSRGYLMCGNGTDEQYKKIRKEIESELAKLYLKK